VRNPITELRTEKRITLVIVKVVTHLQYTMALTKTREYVFVKLVLPMHNNPIIMLACDFNIIAQRSQEVNSFMENYIN